MTRQYELSLASIFSGLKPNAASFFSIGAAGVGPANKIVAHDNSTPCLAGRECSRPAPNRPRVRAASLSITQFLLSHATHHFIGKRLGLLRGLGGGDEGQEVFDDITYAGETLAARREARLRGCRVHYSAHQIISDHGRWCKS